MFKLKQPCANCPFKKGRGKCFRLGEEAINGFVEAVSFQCHKTVDYSYEPGDPRHHGEHPQQCAGLMSLLHRAEKPNQLMQIGERLGYFDPDKLDHSNVYDSLEACIKEHS